MSCPIKKRRHGTHTPRLPSMDRSPNTHHISHRLLADAKFLHQKLSALKNVGTPSGMLETVITEKSIPRKPPPPPASNHSILQNAGSSANQRLKGLLSGKSSAVEKALPTPTPASAVPVRPSSPIPSVPSAPATANGTAKGQMDDNGSRGVNASSAASPPLQVPTSSQGEAAASAASVGFREVAPAVEKGAENPLPAPPALPPPVRTSSASLSDQTELGLAANPRTPEVSTSTWSEAKQVGQADDEHDPDGRGGNGAPPNLNLSPSSATTPINGRGS